VLAADIFVTGRWFSFRSSGHRGGGRQFSLRSSGGPAIWPWVALTVAAVLADQLIGNCKLDQPAVVDPGGRSRPSAADAPAMPHGQVRPGGRSVTGHRTRYGSTPPVSSIGPCKTAVLSGDAQIMSPTIDLQVKFPVVDEQLSALHARARHRRHQAHQ